MTDEQRKLAKKAERKPKKDLTPEEKEALELYKKQMNGEPEAKEGVLDLKERTMLVNGIETQEDSRQYNRFKYVHDFLTSIPMQISYNQQLVEHYLFKYFHRFTALYKS